MNIDKILKEQYTEIIKCPKCDYYHFDRPIDFYCPIVEDEISPYEITGYENILYVTLDNVNILQKEVSLVRRVRVSGSNTKPYYVLLEDLYIKLSNADVIHIPKGFIWDLSSVPRQIWNLLAPDGDAEIASLIHDFLYKNVLYDRKFADDEFYLWSKITSGTSNKYSLRNLDNWIRYKAVRLFGGYIWNKNENRNI